MRVCVLLGGTSAERDVSLVSGLRVAAALRERGHHVIAIDTAHGALREEEEKAMLRGGLMKVVPPDVARLAALDAQLPAMIRDLPDCDVVFLALHGGRGEDGTIQALLDLARRPYTGSGQLASALAMDKELSKRLFAQMGVPTPDWMMAPASADEVERNVGFPCIVKPSKQGSTVGLSLVRERSALAAAITDAFQFDDEVIIERYIPGRELTVTVLGGEALPVGEIIPKHELYDYECKYTTGMAREIFPADLTEGETAEVQSLSILAAKALKLSGCARIDFRMGTDGSFQCLEANTLPGLTELSLVPQAAQAAGMSFPELCERIAMLALHRKGRD
jgi:D-alanine-D-alanine ligase